MKAQWGPRDQKSNFTGSKMGVASALTFNKRCFDLRLCRNAPRLPFQVSQAGCQLADIASGIKRERHQPPCIFKGAHPPSDNSTSRFPRKTDWTHRTSPNESAITPVPIIRLKR